MGVTGLWRLVEPAGKPVPVETLENKVLAVDISIWLHQVVKGYQDAKGVPLPNAHLIGLFQRLCKLLYFRIKPVFVFDGAFPELKKETIAKRQDSKNKYHSESERLKRELVVLLSKKTAIGSLLGKQVSPTKKSNSADTSLNDDLFKLPALPQNQDSESESDDEDTSSGSIVDLHSVDIQSDNFKNMPAKDKYELLLELKETRKMNSWGKLHTLPKKSDNFSDFQMQRLLKRRKVQECLEHTEKEMGDVGMSLNDLESLLNEEGIDTKIESLPTRRIASNNNTRFLLISNVREALAKAKERKDAENKPQTSKDPAEPLPEQEADKLHGKKDELEDDLQKAIQMSLECVDEPESNACQSKTDDSWTSVLTDTDYSEASESECELEQPDVSTAKAYIMQYSDYTHKAIEKIVAPQFKIGRKKNKSKKVDKILQEINSEKSIIVDNVELSSSDDTDDGSEHENSEYAKEVETQKSIETIEDTMESTQASVMLIENTEPNVISLDSSLEESVDSNKKCNLIGETVNVKDSDSSDDEFEEVPEVVDNTRKPVVELTLKMDQVPPDDDDIFADVFAPSNQSNSKREINSENNEEIKEFCEDSIKPEPMDTKYESNEKKYQTVHTIQETLTKHNIDTNNQNKPNHQISKTTANEVQIQPTLEESQKINVTKPAIEDKPEKRVQSPVEKVSEKENTDLLENLTVNHESVESNKLPKEPLTDEKLNSMVEQIQNEEQDLIQEKGRLDRIGRNITEQMTKEAQELLQIFGIPYVVAPMEAEAQCAFLESVKLTDGTITDDSDIWLFGGQTVYKNFFNQKKHVLQYVSDRIERSFNLTREQLILLALLVGSDYTTGVPGVGPVTAMEILASFPFNKKQVVTETSKQVRYSKLLEGLKEFKQWVRAGKRTDNTSLKKKLRNVTLTDDFPSVRVVQAYMEPNIEKSEEKFSWGQLDITVLRDFTKSKFGWSQQKFDEIIKPVLARMKDRKNQKTVHDYFQRKVEFQTLEDQMSKRVKAAVQKMGPEGSLAEKVLDEGVSSKQANKRKKTVKKADNEKAGPSKTKKSKIEVDSDHIVKIVSENDDGKPGVEIDIRKTDRFQEIIPQREKDKQHLLENKLKAIEVFRKTTIDRKRKPLKRKANHPKQQADLSESSNSD